MQGHKKQKERQLAVALEYNRDLPAPRITASGQGEIAKRIIALAEEHGVPLVQDPALAKALSKLPLQAQIPEELYTAVATILAYLYRLDQEVNGAL
ncbi:MAG TPA: type III secretion protein [Firmicutes bacterium]|jgi:flagellar biosynthesis protein|nr:type III secretion protein [Bacillota bacterium]